MCTNPNHHKATLHPCPICYQFANDNGPVTEDVIAHARTQRNHSVQHSLLIAERYMMSPEQTLGLLVVDLIQINKNLETTLHEALRSNNEYLERSL